MKRRSLEMGLKLGSLSSSIFWLRILPKIIIIIKKRVTCDDNFNLGDCPVINFS
jgi:hypothetical protein